jgi:hypothetical protein
MKQNKTEWKPIVGYEGFYDVSNEGQVRNARTKRVLKNQKTKGYEHVSLCVNNLRKELYIHRLVAIAFLQENKEKKEVNHIDGIKTNNSISNLEWVTRSENMIHAIKSGLRDSTILATIKANSKMVLDINSGIFYDSLKDACERTNVKYSTSKKQIRFNWSTQRFKYV